jgi:hypothetical protein
MRNYIVKFTVASQEVEKVLPVQGPDVKSTRLPEESLFNLFTGNIIKLRKKFVR